MLAFAGNSLLCRIALTETAIDAASFTSVRLVSGALVLALLVQLFKREASGSGNNLSALALFLYAACFSFAYLTLDSGMGALILFGAVQASMIGFGLWRGERFSLLQLLGLLLALGGLIALLWPGVSAPPLTGALLMLVAGVAWGVYSLRGRQGGDPTRVSAGNFLRTVPLAVALSLVMLADLQVDTAGLSYAVASGALASALGYAIWYTALPLLKASHAATVQLSVPVIASVGGVLLLDEALTLRLVLAAIAILGGIALVILERR
ncbi:DMT family transporter [Marinobacterium sp. A346]|uniref:DMT family transporter n=2 Tax=Marinobacterium weihaiense TaxID=2851016 RepID=A0ABS6M7C3_9GAMM|nr:DMT family transporter [Marinobacterium weihaiense]